MNLSGNYHNIHMHVTSFEMLIFRCKPFPEVIKKRVDIFVSTADSVQLYKAIFDILRQDYETSDSKGLMRKVQYISTCCYLGCLCSLAVVCDNFKK